MNEIVKTVEILNEEAFIKGIQEVIRAGDGIVPLTGAGASARSGIIVGRDFDHYLSWIIYRCIGRPGWLGAGGKDQTKRPAPHNLRENGWLSRPSAQEVEELVEWVSNRFIEIAKRHGAHFVKTEGNPNGLESSRGAKAAGPGDAVWSRPRIPRVMDGPYEIASEIKDQDEAIRRLLVGKPVEAYLYTLTDPNNRVDSQAGIEEVAIRVMFDWRAMLHFLTRITVRTGRAVLVGQDESIIDSFNQYITRGRKPNLTHTMLAQLVGPLRTRLLLTTNFDTLHEEAFRSLKQPYERLSVSKAQGLPAVQTVRAITSIIKLHGSFTGTRADFSLDDPPSPEECAKFFHYLLGWTPGDYDRADKPAYVPSHLLVIGASGSDVRILHFLKFLLDETGRKEMPQPKIFWICHDEAGAKKVRELFKDDEYARRVVLTVTDRSDLLLLELYQAITLTLPKGGTSYHYAHDVPPQPWPDKGRGSAADTPTTPAAPPRVYDVEQPWLACHSGLNGTDAVTTVFNHLRYSMARIRANSKKDPSCRADITVITSSTRQTGLTPVVTGVFKRVQQEIRKEVLWIELEDFYDVPDAMHHMLHVIALRRGVFQLEHATLLPGRMVKKREAIKGDRARLQDLWREVFDGAKRYLGEVLADYVVCFYARNVPGSCAGWEEKGRMWEENDYKELHIVFELLSEKQLHVLYVPLTANRIVENNNKIGRLIETPQDEQEGEPVFKVPDSCADAFFEGRSGWHELSLDLKGREKPMVGGLVELKKELLANAGKLRWPELRLLYAVSLFRQSRPPSVFLTDPLYPSSPETRFNDQGIDSDWVKQSVVTGWLEKYRKAELMWRKPGGSSWMYRDGLLGLRLMLEDPKAGWGDGINFIGIKSRTHFWIARWYFRAFCSSNHVVPLLESFHHFYQCAVHLEYAKCPEEVEVRKYDKAHTEERYRAQRLIRVLTEWVKVMRIGRPALQFWLDRPASEGWLSEAVIEKISRKISEIAAGNPYATDLAKMLILELERCRLSLERGNFFSSEAVPSVPHGYEAGVTSAEIEKVKIFRAWAAEEKINPSLVEDIWCPPLRPGECQEEMAQAGREMTNSLVLALMTEREGADYIKLKSVAFSKLTIDPDFNGKLPVALSMLKERLYALVRFAKSLDMEEALKADAVNAQTTGLKGMVPPPLLPSRHVSRSYWRRVNILGRVIFDLCAFCPPALLRLDMNIRVSVLTLRALAHGRLGRFYQAHRRLNEAHAILTRMAPGPEEGDLFAFIELRRAEVCLLEADQVARLLALHRATADKKARDVSFFYAVRKNIADDILRPVAGRLGPNEIETRNTLYRQLEAFYGLKGGQRDGLPKLLAAKLDDAWAALENAEHLLSGQTRAALSWGRLCTLKLRLFAHHKRRDVGHWELLALRRRQELQGELSRWLRLGFANWADDPYRQLRLAWYFVKARMNWADLQPGRKLFESTATPGWDLSRDDDDINLISTLVENWEYKKAEIIRIEHFRDSFFSFIRLRDPKSRERKDIQEALRTLVWDANALRWQGCADATAK